MGGLDIVWVVFLTHTRGGSMHSMGELFFESHIVGVNFFLSDP